MFQTISRKGTKGEKEPAFAAVTITGAAGATVFEKKLPVNSGGTGYDHGGHTCIVKTGKGVARVAVSDIERWASFTYPATPLVLIGEGADGKDAAGWKRFRFSVCAPRNWYFFVPKGVKEFAVRFAADFPTDVLNVEVCARTGSWHSSMAGAGADRRRSGWARRQDLVCPPVDRQRDADRLRGPGRFRYQDSPMTFELKGVPGYLAPTWNNG